MADAKADKPKDSDKTAARLRRLAVLERELARAKARLRDLEASSRT